MQLAFLPHSMEIMNRSRSRCRSSNPVRQPVQFHEEIIGDFAGWVYVDLEVRAHIPKHGQIGYALALYDRSTQQLTLADVQIDAPWRGQGICTKLVERILRLGRGLFTSM